MIFLCNSSDTSVLGSWYPGSDQESLHGWAVHSFHALGLAIQSGGHQPHVTIEHLQFGDSELRYTVGIKYHQISEIQYKERM